VDYTFVDMRVTPVGCETIDRWLEQVDIELLFNKRGTTYRKLGLKEKNLDAAGMREWLCRENTLIKRPVVVTDNGRVFVGFDEDVYATF
jgi:arsenate reductase-like glutaredoxin family protein